MGFTDNQKLAITSSESDILVSAAAGSGKTTVLVERIIRRVLDKDNPIDIDRMLVLTFTKAAAAQMREKILNEIEKKHRENPLDEHIVRQSMLIQNAQISTFHGFCQEIIRNHFYEIDADPQFRVMDETEGTLMKADVLDKVLEEAYETADEDFLNMIESYSGKKNDKSVVELILKVFALSQAHPDPDKWLDTCENAYMVNSVEDIKNTQWFGIIRDSVSKSALYACNIAEEMVRICKMDGGPLKYLPTAEDDLNFVKSINNATDFQEIISICRVHTKGRLATITKKDSVDADLQQLFKNKRDLLQTITDDIKKLALRPLDEEVEVMKKVAPLAKVIVKLVRDFGNEFAKAKADAGVIDFNDMEHLAIKILRNQNSTACEDYKQHFEEIYVDEYQDSNLTQEEIISLIGRSENGLNGNIFMVGDVKQSIYRFRMARPDLFLGKYNSFKHDSSSGKGHRIDLSDNFRSRTEVLDATNEIFEQIMNKDLGGIEYDDAASLHYGHLYDQDVSDTDYTAELILATVEEELSAVEAEAYAIAAKINEIVGKIDVKDTQTGQMRKAKYSDIVILLRSMGGRDSVYRRILLDSGIPSYVTTGTGYFSAKEIETVLNFLSVIDNPLQDIPLAASLKSNIGGFYDDELAILRAINKKGSLYGVLCSIAADDFESNTEAFRKNVPDESEEYINSLICDIHRKAVEFLNLFNHFREESEYMSVYEILREIIDGSYGDYYRSGTNGVQATANLNMLLKKAEDFGKLSYKGLFHFLRYIAQMRKYEVDYGEAGITDENDTNVRIMTIHKSKGLEFPIVFVSGISKKRNKSDEGSEVIADPDFGIGLNYVDIANRLKKSTFLREFLSDRIRKENIAEEIRVLYVALTRAKEKLYLVGSVKDAEKEFYGFEKPLEKCSSYLEMIAFANNKSGGLKNLKMSTVGYDDYVIADMKDIINSQNSFNAIRDLMKQDLSDTEKEWLAPLEFVYPYKNDGPEHAKVSVSELKKKSMEETFDIEGYEPYVPDFAREKEEDKGAGTFYGTAFHRMLELWDYSISFRREDEVTESEVDEYFSRMLSEGKIDGVQLEAVKSSEILIFLRSETAKRMGKAASEGRLYREQPFFIGVDPGMMLVQGIIDAYWIEDDGIVILDYKTDRVKKGQDLVDRYHVQLEYYEMALSRLTLLPVKEKIIYAARLKESVTL